MPEAGAMQQKGPPLASAALQSLALLAADHLRFAHRLPRGVDCRLSMKVATVGQWVKATSSTSAGSSSNQAWIWRERFMIDASQR